MPRVVLLAPSTSYRTGDFLRAARDLGVDVTVGSNCEPVLAGAGDGALQVALADPSRAATQVAAFARTHPVHAVLATDDGSVLAAAHAARTLGLEHNPPEAVAVARDKYAFRRSLMRAQVHGPSFRLVALDHADALAREIGYPCVVKPRSLSASRGVIRANAPVEFGAACRRIRAILMAEDPLADPAHRRTVLVEDYLPGAEVALEGILDDGHLHTIALMDKPDPLEGPFFEETVLVTPSRHERSVQGVITEAVQHAARAIGLRHGPIHAEARIGARGVSVIEVAPRSIGGLCSRAIALPDGASLESAVLRHAVDGTVPAPAPEDVASGVMMIPIPRPGRLARVDGVEEARAMPGIRDIVIAISTGEALLPAPEGGRYLGFIFAEGATPAEVEGALRQAHRRLEVAVEP